MYISIFKALRRSVALCLAWLAILPSAQALDPQISIGSYRHDRWSDLEGAPSLIDAMAQTDDGWLWLATRRSGLYRFDGVRFTAYTTRDGSRLQNASISALRAGANNELWIGHGLTGGVSVLRDHRLKHVLGPQLTGSIYAIAQGADGSTWIASRLGLFRVRNDIAQRMDAAHGYGGDRSEYVMADSQGRIWASDGVHLFLLEPGQASFRTVRPVEHDPTVIEAGDGSLWLVLGKHFERLTAATPPRVPGRPGRGNSYQSAFDANGNLWTGNCPVGLCVVRPGAWQGKDSFDAAPGNERFDQGWQMTSLEVVSVLTDREGSLWIGTSAGLDRLRDQPVHFVDQLFDRGTAQALPHPDGGIIVLAAQRLNGVLDLLHIVDGKAVQKPNPLNARAMARAPDGSLVLAGSAGIERQHATRTDRIPLPPLPAPAGKAIGFRSITAGNDELWARIVGAGIWRFRHGAWKEVDFIRSRRAAIAVDAADQAWIGDEERLWLIDGARNRQIDTSAADVGVIEFIHADKDVIVSGSRGYGVVKDGRLQALRFATSKALGPLNGIAHGPDGVVWINASQGLFRVSAQDWARTIRDPRVALNGTLFDALDGYLGGAETIWLSDTVFVAGDGKVWFSGERGLAWLDPRALRPNRVTADVDVLGLTSDGRRYLPGASIELGPGARDVEIDYASPSLRLPQRVQFRYRMLGADTQWENAGTRRTAFYKNLAPGNYTFEVTALNDSGVPSPRAALLHFRIAPRITETSWFYAACALAAIVLLWLAYRLRVRHLAARLEERFAIRTAERESVARSLHDTFLQSVQGLLFSMQALLARLPPSSTAQRELHTLIEQARRVLVEGRDEVKGLRSDFDSSAQFWETLLRDAGTIRPGSGERIALDVHDAIDKLQPELHHNVYAVAREALVNALCHTDGAVEIAARAGELAFLLTVRDHGQGLGEFRKGRPGHYGLQGMREHAMQIGAKLDIDDAAGGGTQVALSIPAHLAYRQKSTRT